MINTSKLIIVMPIPKYETAPIELSIAENTIRMPPKPNVNPLYIFDGNYPMANPIYANIIR